MKLRDWRAADGAALAPLYALERSRWLAALRWDPEHAWHEVEHARATWGLPGIVAVDGRDRIRGAAFYLCEEDRLDVGGVLSDDEETAALLVRAVLDVARTAGMRPRCFLYESTPLRPSFEGAGVPTESFFYLSRRLDAAAPGNWVSDAWQARDAAAVASLLAQCYDQESGRVFAPNGTHAEWTRYITGLIEQVGCGRFDAGGTRIIRAEGEVVAAAIVTTISPRTAHLAQLAVHPSARGHGVGQALLADACRAMSATCDAMTLIVSPRNTGARALYDKAGFAGRPAFVASCR